jgi:hypothetical protein
MNLSIESIRKANSDEWDKIWQKCNYSTYFHSREWAEIWQSFKKGKIIAKPKLITFSDGKTALLPLSLQTEYKGIISLYASSLEETFGGWISTDELTVEHAKLLANFLTKKLGGNLVWRFNPYDELVFKAGVNVTTEDETHAIKLEESVDTITKNRVRLPVKLVKLLKKAYQSK